MQEKKDPQKKWKQPLDSYTKYTGIAFQMIAIIGLGTFAGYRIDKWLQLHIPVFTIILILLSVALALYSVFRTLK
jgi:F0F1-type ATP synthase assembly protein I